MKVGSEDLLRLGLGLEGHADNLAAALVGGVCLTWSDDGDQRVAQVATEAAARRDRRRSRASRVPRRGRARGSPALVAHDDAAHTAGRAALLGAALAAGDGELLAAAFHDALHEPYRGDDAPLLSQLRDDPPAGCVGVTLSGAGPSVVVWARKEDRDECVDELRRRLPDAQVLPLEVAPHGAEEEKEERWER